MNNTRNPGRLLLANRMPGGDHSADRLGALMKSWIARPDTTAIIATNATNTQLSGRDLSQG
jgi:hypothetical protein